MKLLDTAKAEVAVLDEGTTKVAYYGKDPALIYFEAVKNHGIATSQTCTVKKIESLEGYIKTDGGTEVKIEGTLAHKIGILETLLGCKLGYIDPAGVALPGLPLPHATVEFYKEHDTDDAGTIKVSVTVGAADPVVFTFTRGPNAVTVADVLAKLSAPEGKEIVGIVPAGTTSSEAKTLNPTDKILEDSEFVAVLVEPVTITVKRNSTEGDTETVNVAVPYTANVEAALGIIAENETVKGWVQANAATATLKDIVREDGTTIGTKAKKASASTLTAVKLSWELLTPVTE